MTAELKVLHEADPLSVWIMKNCMEIASTTIANLFFVSLYSSLVRMWPNPTEYEEGLTEWHIRLRDMDT